jgi:hypothetical protein
MAILPRVTDVSADTMQEKALPKHKKSDDEIWDELLSTPESKTLLRLMADEALREHKQGTTTEHDG